MNKLLDKIGILRPLLDKHYTYIQVTLTTVWLVKGINKFTSPLIRFIHLKMAKHCLKIQMFDLSFFLRQALGLPTSLDFLSQSEVDFIDLWENWG